MVALILKDGGVLIWVVSLLLCNSSDFRDQFVLKIVQVWKRGSIYAFATNFLIDLILHRFG